MWRSIVLDRSQSMQIGTRARRGRQGASPQFKKKLAAQKDLESVSTDRHHHRTGEDNGTQAFAALNAALADVPPSRVAGAILITDGEVHDAPADSLAPARRCRR